jgi:ATP-dependent RNA helicase DOB1
MTELHRAAAAVGDTELAVKFEAGAESMRHGVVFAASLYL